MIQFVDKQHLARVRGLAKTVLRSVALLLWLLLAGSAITEAPAPPKGVVVVTDWGAFDQERANQLRLQLVELQRRWPAGETVELSF
jgi:hypothetical protein